MNGFFILIINIVYFKNRLVNSDFYRKILFLIIKKRKISITSKSSAKSVYLKLRFCNIAYS